MQLRTAILLLVFLYGLLPASAQDAARPDPLSAEAGEEAIARYLEQDARVDQPWERLLDRNRDGEIDERELRAARKRINLPAWKRGDRPPAPRDKRGAAPDAGPILPPDPPAGIDPEPDPAPIPAVSPLEKRYDKDRNGLLSREEAVALFTDRLNLARAAGAVIIASGLEGGADLDGDGLLLPQEIERALKTLAGEQVVRRQ